MKLLNKTKSVILPWWAVRQICKFEKT